MHMLTKKHLVAAVLGLGAGGALGISMIMPTTPAKAITVFDPSNYAQNILTAARTLQQVNQQIQQL